MLPKGNSMVNNTLKTGPMAGPISWPVNCISKYSSRESSLD